MPSPTIGRRTTALTAVDNLFRGHRQAVDRRAAFHFNRSGRHERPGKALAEHSIDCVMHFAALAYVASRLPDPLAYYQTTRRHDQPARR